MVVLGIKILSEIFTVHLGLIFFHSASACSKYFNSEIAKAVSPLRGSTWNSALTVCMNARVCAYPVLESPLLGPAVIGRGNQFCSRALKLKSYLPVKS